MDGWLVGPGGRDPPRRMSQRSIKGKSFAADKEDSCKLMKTNGNRLIFNSDRLAVNEKRPLRRAQLSNVCTDRVSSLFNRNVISTFSDIRCQPNAMNAIGHPIAAVPLIS